MRISDWSSDVCSSDLSVRAITAGKAVFCEKPIDMDLARVRSAAATLGAPGTRMLLGFNRRFDPNFRALRDRLAGGTMGAVETIHRSEEHTSELQSLMRISYAVFCLKKKKEQQSSSYYIPI